MEKSEMMKKFEAETGKQSAIVKFMSGGQALERKSYPKLGPYDYNMEYLAWLESKATAYDRLMSGGKKTLNEWANIFGMVVTVDRDGEVWAFDRLPVRDESIWRNNEAHYGQGAFEIPKKLVEFDGDWKDSLTLPDGLESDIPSKVKSKDIPSREGL